MYACYMNWVFWRLLATEVYRLLQDISPAADSLGNIWKHIIQGLEIAAHCDCWLVCSCRWRCHMYVMCCGSASAVVLTSLASGRPHHHLRVSVTWLGDAHGCAVPTCSCRWRCYMYVMCCYSASAVVLTSLASGRPQLGRSAHHNRSASVSRPRSHLHAQPDHRGQRQPTWPHHLTAPSHHRTATQRLCVAD